MSASETIVLSFRSKDTAGSVTTGAAYTFNADTGDSLALTEEKLASLAADRNVLFIVHGFNVPARNGRYSGAAMQEDLHAPSTPNAISATDLVVIVLWPGDWTVKIVNYSWEYSDAVTTGKNLAGMIERHFQRAASISMASHSLGARVVLEAASRLQSISVQELVITAGAADRDCLTRQYPRAVKNTRRISVLRSMRDWTLMLAYPAGDFLSDLMGDNDSPFGGALGRYGPKPVDEKVRTTKIPSEPHDPSGKKERMISDFDHTDYFPTSVHPRPAMSQKSDTVSRFIAAAFAGAPPYWR